MCTKLPNWGSEYELSVGASGFLTTQCFEGGESYFNRNTNQYQTVRFTNVYLKDFIPDKEYTDKIIL